jgi:hypothetical protein
MLPLDYLQAIEHASFPLEEADPAKIKCIELLRAVGYLDATITLLASQGNQARVARITWTGRMALENHKTRSAQPGKAE